VTNGNKSEYIQLVVDHYIGHMIKAIQSMKEGFEAIVPTHLLEEFTFEGTNTNFISLTRARI
jgi:hypothetical protein